MMAQEGPLGAGQLQAMKAGGEKIVVLTCYDASMTMHCEQAGVDVLLVGDSLGMVVQGHDSTLPVTMDDMIYHTRLVARARQRCLLATDMPYRSYLDQDQALQNARRLTEEGGADMVKLEGGGKIIDSIAHLTANGIRVCGHLGLLPQSVEELGGYKIQGREQDAATRMCEDALGLQQAGAEMIVLECIPAGLARRISESLQIPTIGIGAGVGCDGQVLVIYDLLGITPGKQPRFAKDFLAALSAGKGITAAIETYVTAVRKGAFPDDEHSFT
ncbi:MAG: 3-methyl-2-oxobutanoate hydroxymethyltransferase [Proteobacteria bacterium]|jgi:3-methyl-2-oxobutanoate hydroxymethyltransferase|nr:3-methyl-2-oxobutanoate hydroxymethyltransferase [Pseudomonadota bacterium]